MERDQKAVNDVIDELDLTLRSNEQRINELVKELDRNPIHDRDDISYEFSRLMIRSFKGDYLKLSTNQKILKVLQAYEDGHIIFSDYVTKLNRYNFKQKRILIITDNGIYNFNTDYTLKRQSRIIDLNSISLSRKASNILVVHHKVDHDYLYLTTKRDEIMNHIFNLYESATGNILQYQFGERLYVADKNMYHRDINIKSTEKPDISSSSLFMPLGI